MSVPLSPLELKLERSKRISNARFDFLDRLYDRRPIGERYAAGDIHLHLHGRLASDGMWCVTLVSPTASEVLLKAGMDIVDEVSAGLNELPVFVRIGEVAKTLRPIASVVRLRSLDQCHMRGAEEMEPETLFVSLKSLWRVFKRELSIVLRRSGIELGEFENEPVQRGTQVVTDFPDKNGESQIVKCLGRKSRLDRAMRGIRIEVDAEGIRLFCEHNPHSAFEVSKVFLCPSYSFEAATERVMQIIDHP